MFCNQDLAIKVTRFIYLKKLCKLYEKSQLCCAVHSNPVRVDGPTNALTFLIDGTTNTISKRLCAYRKFNFVTIFN